MSMSFTDTANTAGTEPLPLEGVTVIELGNVVMVPFAAQLLGDLGARVIRIEGERKDSGRVIGGVVAPGLSGAALNLQRNKESIQLDLKSADGLEIAHRLVAGADVFVTNMRRGALGRLGLDHDTVVEVNPAIIYVAANGFADGSPDADRPAFDDIIQAETGLPALTGRITGRPRFLPTLIADKLSGMYVVQGVLAALVRRGVTGRGGVVEVPMFDSVLSFNLVEHLAGAAIEGGHAGYSRILSEHRGPHRTKDGWVAVMPYSDEDWRALYEHVGHGDELDDPIFQDHALRLENPDIVYKSLAEVMAQGTTQEWVDLCFELGVPAAPIHDLDEVVDDPGLHRGVIADATHPVVGAYRHVHYPVRFDGEHTPVRTHAPLIGENTEALLAELGYDEDDTARLLAAGAATAASLDEAADAFTRQR